MPCPLFQTLVESGHNSNRSYLGAVAVEKMVWRGLTSIVDRIVHARRESCEDQRVGSCSVLQCLAGAFGFILSPVCIDPVALSDRISVLSPHLTTVVACLVTVAYLLCMIPCPSTALVLCRVDHRRDVNEPVVMTVFSASPRFNYHGPTF